MRIVGIVAHAATLQNIEMSAVLDDFLIMLQQQCA